MSANVNERKGKQAQLTVSTLATKLSVSKKDRKQHKLTIMGSGYNGWYYFDAMLRSLWL